MFSSELGSVVFVLNKAALGRVVSVASSNSTNCSTFEELLSYGM
jgi:hypothetical protein